MRLRHMSYFMDHWCYCFFSDNGIFKFQSQNEQHYLHYKGMFLCSSSATPAIVFTTNMIVACSSLSSLIVSFTQKLSLDNF